MNYLEIEEVIRREIIDSRENPTVEAEIVLIDDTVGGGVTSSGASTGEFEVLELRNHGNPHSGGEGVLEAVRSINIVISDTLEGVDVVDVYTMDRAMIRTGGTKNKPNLEANTILAISIACMHATANGLDLPLCRFLDGISGNRLPVPMMNILNDDARTANTVGV